MGKEEDSTISWVFMLIGIIGMVVSILNEQYFYTIFAIILFLIGLLTSKKEENKNELVSYSGDTDPDNSVVHVVQDVGPSKKRQSQRQSKEVL